ncbi:MAG: ATP-binding protein [Kofleriaceae bacterium]
MTIKILLVDDRPENLLSLQELIKQPERELFTATSGNDALRLLLKHDFAVVLLDVEMPGMDGYETAALMRGAERTRLVPIIFVTAGDRSEERTFKGYESGAVDFLYKPLNPHTLKCKVDVFTELYRKSRDLEAANEQLRLATMLLRDKVTDLEDVNHTLSHDLRAPLRSIQGFSQALAESLEGKLDEESGRHLDRVLKASARMQAMLDDLYRLLKLSGAGTQFVSIDTGSLVHDVLENLKVDIEQAGVTIEFGTLPSVRGNRALVSQILQNLIINAIRFRCDTDPRIELAAESQGEWWRFTVRDNGIGIPAEDHERMFQLFQRRDSDSPGTGVGLALCKRAVEKLGGRIWVESQPGAGATFYFTLPKALPRLPEPDPE